MIGSSIKIRRAAQRDRGFTLIELMIVITIIFILIGIAAARYDVSVQRAKEATLKTDLADRKSVV